MKDSKSQRTFFLSFSISLAALIVMLGLLTVDARGREMSFGDDTPPLHVVKHEDGTAELEYEVMGVHGSLDFTFFDKTWDYICDFGCIPHR